MTKQASKQTCLPSTRYTRSGSQIKPSRVEPSAAACVLSGSRRKPRCHLAGRSPASPCLCAYLDLCLTAARCPELLGSPQWWHQGWWRRLLCDLLQAVHVEELQWSWSNIKPLCSLTPQLNSYYCRAKSRHFSPHERQTVTMTHCFTTPFKTLPSHKITQPAFSSR